MKDVISDLCDRMDLIRLRYAVVFRPGAAAIRAAPPYIPMAEALARGLLAEDANAIQIARTLVDPADADRAEFWGTPLGQLMFNAGAYPKKTCTQATAAAVLGCSRQWVSAMVSDGKLCVAMPRGVFVDEVRAVLKSRLNRLAVDRIVK